MGGGKTDKLGWRVKLMLFFALVLGLLLLFQLVYVLPVVHGHAIRMRILFANIILFAITLVVSLVVIQRITAGQRRAEHDLEIAHHKVMNAREDERRRLAGELHDSIGQSLIALQLSIRNILATEKEKIDLEMMESCLAVGNKCTALVREVRNICHGLYPPTLEALGLISAIRQLSGQYDSDIDFELHCPAELSRSRFSAETEIVLFRVAQEALNNIQRHSKASKVEFHLKQSDDVICMTIIDNGCGFDPSDMTMRGLGLHTMHDRAHAIDGSLKIISRPGKTKIEVCVPAHPEMN